jgi:quercetin dioxygenase-like cupin family protein
MLAERHPSAYRRRMTTQPYTFYADLAAEASPPARGIHSQTVSKADGVELVLFAMADGEQLSEHTSARPAIVHVLSGEGELVVDGDSHPLKPGAWLRMAPRTAHAITAHGPLAFALYLLPSAAA